MELPITCWPLEQSKCKCLQYASFEHRLAGPKLELHAQAKLLEVYRATHEVREARQHNELVLAINRSDYMLDEPSGTLLQVWYRSEKK